MVAEYVILHTLITKDIKTFPGFSAQLIQSWSTFIILLMPCIFTLFPVIFFSRTASLVLPFYCQNLLLCSFTLMSIIYFPARMKISILFLVVYKTPRLTASCANKIIAFKSLQSVTVPCFFFTAQVSKLRALETNYRSSSLILICDHWRCQ